MAISMLGFFHFQTPSFIQNLQHNKYFKQHSDISAFISGLLAGVVASPCVGPVLVGILSFVAKSQNIKLGFALLFTFALGFGLLFIFLAFFEDAKKIFPKSGPWMEFTKILFAGIMFSFALFYVQSIVSFILFSSLISLASLVLIFASVKIMKEYQLQKSFFWQFVLLKLIGIFAISTIQSVYGENRFIHKWLQEYSAQALIWQNYNEKLLQEAKNQKPIIIDFTADWCLACTELKTRTFTDSKIRDLQDQFVFLQFDATRSSDLLENLKAKYKVIGLPTILFLDQNLNEITDLRLTGFEDANAFLARMKKAIESNAKNCAKPSDLNNMTCTQ